MVDYDSFARFYDDLMGEDAIANAKRVDRAIAGYFPEASTLLELGCGTGGGVLGRLSGMRSITGLDRSPAMLTVAGAKVPRARLVEADMRAFDLGEGFDVVVCVYDTLNHLPTFDDWQEVFRRVRDHLPCRRPVHLRCEHHWAAAPTRRPAALGPRLHWPNPDHGRGVAR